MTWAFYTTRHDSGQWYGEPHTLIVRSVRLPDGQFDDGDLEYDLQHPPSCGQEEVSYGDGVAVLTYTCDVAHDESECGLAYSLRYSGTPITEPGTYRIRGWGRKIHHWEYGDEYDAGVAVMDPGDVAS